MSVYDEATHKGLLRHIYVRRGAVSGQILVCLVCNGEKLPKVDALLARLKKIPGFTTLVLSVNRSKGNAVINLMGTVGGIYTLIMIKLLIKENANAADVNYLPIFIAVASLMAICAIVLSAAVNERKLKAETGYFTRRTDLSDDGSFMISVNGDAKYMKITLNVMDGTYLIEKISFADFIYEIGNNNVELVYTDADGRHEVVLPRETDGASTLESYLAKGVTINSYKELMPRMNDIFIKLVTEGR